MPRSEPRPLYVAGTSELSVLRDGPSLRVVQPGRADRAYPLRLVSRLVITGHARLTSAALTACLEHGIPATFLKPDGSPLGYCLPGEARNRDINGLLDDALEHPRFAEWYDAWRRALTTEAMRACLARLSQDVPDPRPDVVTRAIVNALAGSSPPLEPSDVHRRLEGLLAAHLPRLFVEHGVAPRFLGRPGAPINLFTDVRAMLRWHLWPVAARFLIYSGRHPAKARCRGECDARLARIYESHAPMMRVRFRRIMASLQVCLGDAMP
jgi:hypothetical protein